MPKQASSIFLQIIRLGINLLAILHRYTLRA